MTRPAVARLALLALAGCTLGPDYRRPPVPTPDAWRTPAGGEGSLADLRWWHLFQDPALQGLVAAALDANTDLRLAAARVLEARAQLGLTRSGQVPQVDANGRVTTQRVSEVGAVPVPPGGDVEEGLLRATLDLSFELDLWGRLRRATEAARAELLATEDARRTVALTLGSDVAQSYFDLRELDLELAIARRTLESRRESLRIVTLRQQEGLTAPSWTSAGPRARSPARPPRSPTSSAGSPRPSTG